MSSLTITLIILGLTVVIFLSGKFPLGACGLFCAMALMVTGVLKPNEALSGFADTNVAIMVAMMVVSGGLMRTSMISKIIKMIGKVGNSEKGIIAGFGILAAILSQFMNSFVAMACILPLIEGMCDDLNLSRSKVIFPIGAISLAWVAMFPVGIGASAFAQMNGYLASFGSKPLFNMWTLTWTRIPSSIVVTLFCIFVLPKLCPAQPSVPIKTNLGKKIDSGSLSPIKEKLSYVISIGTILMMMTSALHGVQPYISAMLGGLLMVLLGVLTEQEAVGSISWSMIFMFAGILPLGTALTKTGASTVIANSIQGMLGGTTNVLLINIAFALTVWILTQIMSNTAIIAVFTPIALAVTTKLGMNPVGIMGLVYIAATASYLTPMASPGIPLLMGAGGYNFKDTIKIGFFPAITALVAGIIWCTLVFPAY